MPVSYQRESWLVRMFDPRPHAERERVVDYLVPLYHNERELAGGRFHSYEAGGWFDNCSTVSLSHIEQQGERTLQIEIMLEWIAREGGVWYMEAPHCEDLSIEFWFADPYAASVFDLMFGGVPRKIVRD